MGEMVNYANGQILLDDMEEVGRVYWVGTECARCRRYGSKYEWIKGVERY